MPLVVIVVVVVVVGVDIDVGGDDGGGDVSIASAVFDAIVVFDHMATD